jgi:hypothetical protein
LYWRSIINSIWNKEEFPDQWKGYQFVPVHGKRDKADCSNYHGISLVSISSKILPNIILWRLSPYIDEIIGDHLCGFWCNRSTTDQIFCIRQILEKKWEYNETVHQLFRDFKKAYDSSLRNASCCVLVLYMSLFSCQTQKCTN